MFKFNRLKWLVPSRPKTKLVLFTAGLFVFGFLQLVKWMFLHSQSAQINDSALILPFAQTSYSGFFSVFCLLFLSVFFVIFLYARDISLSIILAVCLPPAFSNCLDPLIYDGVVDYFTLSLFKWPALVFNLDDLLIVTAFCMLTIWTVFQAFSYYRGVR